MKKEGLIEIDKNEIVALAESITPGFSEWMKKKAQPLMDLGSDGPHQMARAVDVDTETDIIQYRMKQVESTYFQTPYWTVEPYATGTITAWEDNFESYIVSYINPTETGKFFMIIPPINDQEIASWSIGEEKIYY